MYLNLKFISTEVANKLHDILSTRGLPSMDRILVFSPKETEFVQGGIIIPGTSKEERPNKGVVIHHGFISDEYAPYKDLTKPGMIITYGMYAGKEIDFDPEIFKEAGLSLDLEGNKFTVLAINEIIYSEVNNN